MKVLIVITIFVILQAPLKVFSYNENTHVKVTSYAVTNRLESVDLILKSAGIVDGLRERISDKPLKQTPTVRGFIEFGGQEEDNPFFLERYLNHFYDPLTSAGLNDFFTGGPSYAWANYPDNIWSWQVARREWYIALTQTDLNARNAALAKSFRSLGQVMHLLQDKAVPAHVRNDAHLSPDPFESYVEKQVDNLKPYAIYFQGGLPAGRPNSFRQLWDMDLYTGATPLADTKIGLAEYTNANFASNDTIFSETYQDDFNPFNDKHYYPFPRRSDMEIVPEPTGEVKDGYILYRKYFSKERGGEVVKHFAVASRLYKYLEEDPSPVLKGFDDKCHADYAAKLIPRAIGYSASLLDYFFRGQIEVSLPPQGVYALANNPAVGGFGQIKLLARNTTDGVEEMSQGTVTLIVRYRTAFADPFEGTSVPVSNEEFQLMVTKEGVAIHRTPVELTFDLPKPLPLWATDVTLQLIYSGRLGVDTASGFSGEEEAVALGFKDVSEPSPFDIINGTDVLCINDTIVAAGSEAALAVIGLDGRPVSETYDVFPHAYDDVYLKFSTSSSPVIADATHYDARLDRLLPGHYARLFYITDPVGASSALLSYRTRSTPIDSRDIHPVAASKESRFGIAGRVNQEVTIDGEPVRSMSNMEDLRGLKSWWWLYYYRNPYPTGSGCIPLPPNIPLAGVQPFDFAAP